MVNSCYYNYGQLWLALTFLKANIIKAFIQIYKVDSWKFKPQRSFLVEVAHESLPDWGTSWYLLLSWLLMVGLPSVYCYGRSGGRGAAHLHLPSHLNIILRTDPLLFLSIERIAISFLLEFKVGSGGFAVVCSVPGASTTNHQSRDLGLLVLQVFSRFRNLLAVEQSLKRWPLIHKRFTFLAHISPRWT